MYIYCNGEFKIFVYIKLYKDNMEDFGNILIPIIVKSVQLLSYKTTNNLIYVYCDDVLCRHVWVILHYST